MVSELFDPDAWEPVTDEFDDITYHRGVDVPVVRIAFDRPEVRNAFRPGTVDELYAALDHARKQADVGCVLLTGNGPSEEDGGWAFCSGGDQSVRGGSGYEYRDGDEAGDEDEPLVGGAEIHDVAVRGFSTKALGDPASEFAALRRRGEDTRSHSTNQHYRPGASNCWLARASKDRAIVEGIDYTHNTAASRCGAASSVQCLIAQ
mgnify:CR=1 FL=1